MKCGKLVVTDKALLAQCKERLWSVSNTLAVCLEFAEGTKSRELAKVIRTHLEQNKDLEHRIEGELK